MRVFITGGAGFIGSHLCDALLKEGHQVSILDNMSTGSAANIAHIKDQIEIHQGDIRDVALVEKAMAPADLVLHMAAALGVNTILENPIESVSTNFTGSEVVLNAATKLKKRIIIASTSEIYGKNPKQPLSETDDRVVGPPQKIRWTYSDAKALEEAIAHALFLTKQLKVTTIRLFNTVGPRQTGRYGMVLPRFVQSALKNEPITIYGDGTQSRVFCHVSDAVRAIITIAKTDSTIGEVYNIGGVGETTIKQLAEKIIERTNSNSTLTYTPYDQAYTAGYEDMQRRVPDITKIKNAIGWSPENTLDSIIDDVAAEMKK
ncbi:UDP-glucose 4-epimerase [Candidatus Planktophila lacus]|uniref:NAD-dependent epimerase/dehydratase family protein n=1 Tax=Candidatus Planktophila lacus TaxID=1884913 RepID=UPI000BAC585E|nr:SDR family NAD(P)-dependent oxidoreductase [Candidatus Planktophila lacus]ASY24528.1 UDP-glucose 4-epimerase [Candidatus Planktophila lacus]